MILYTFLVIRAQHCACTQIYCYRTSRRAIRPHVSVVPRKNHLIRVVSTSAVLSSDTRRRYRFSRVSDRRQWKTRDPPNHSGSRNLNERKSSITKCPPYD